MSTDGRGKLVVVALLCLTGCAAKHAAQANARITRINAGMQAWEGRAEAAVIAAYGKPDREIFAKEIAGAGSPLACDKIPTCLYPDRVLIYYLKREVGGYYRAATPSTTTTTVTQKPGLVIPMGAGITLDTRKMEATTTTTPGTAEIAIPPATESTTMAFWVRVGDQSVYHWYWRDWDGRWWQGPDR